jgi:hypothetical protein
VIAARDRSRGPRTLWQELPFETTEKTLDGGVVPAIADAAHARDEASSVSDTSGLGRVAATHVRCVATLTLRCPRKCPRVKNTTTPGLLISCSQRLGFGIWGLGFELAYASVRLFMRGPNTVINSATTIQHAAM